MELEIEIKQKITVINISFNLTFNYWDFFSIIFKNIYFYSFLIFNSLKESFYLKGFCCKVSIIGQYIAREAHEISMPMQITGFGVRTFERVEYSKHSIL